MADDFDNYGLGSDETDGEEITVTITLDNGEDIDCLVLTIFEADGRDYIALLPLEGDSADGGEVFLYRYIEDEDGNSDIANIESDEEYEIAADAFDELLDDEEFDEIDEDIDDEDDEEDF